MSRNCVCVSEANPSVGAGFASAAISVEWDIDAGLVWFGKMCCLCPRRVSPTG